MTQVMMKYPHRNVVQMHGHASFDADGSSIQTPGVDTQVFSHCIVMELGVSSLHYEIRRTNGEVGMGWWQQGWVWLFWCQLCRGTAPPSVLAPRPTRFR